MNESGRFSLTQLEEGQTLIPRKNEINEILAHLDEAIKKKPYGKKHLVIVKGPAGIGKTTLLEMLRTDLLEEGNCRVTDRLDFGDLLKEDDDNPLLSAFEKCAGSALGRRGRTALDKRANAAQAMFEALNPTETSLPLIVFIDGLEQGLPLSLPPNKKKRVSEVCNLLIELLLRRPGLPAFIIAAARTTPDQPLPFLARAQWTASRVEICLMAFDSAQIQAGPAKDVSPAYLPKLLDFAQGNPLLAHFLAQPNVAARLANDNQRNDVLREAIVALTHPHLINENLRKLMWNLVRNGNRFQTEETALAPGGPYQLSDMKGTAWVDSSQPPQPLYYFVIEPLATLLREVDHV